MRKCFLFLLSFLMFSSVYSENYIPSSENLKARNEFENARFGIFIHWGLYSIFGQGEWFMHNMNINNHEYAKVANAFYPHDFNADKWVKTFKDAGAKYICFTTRHHDGFSMWATKQSDYNVVNSTPYHKDIVKMLAEACHNQNMSLHLYYSHLDWTRDDYWPLGRTGHGTGRTNHGDFSSYYQFMNNQLTELLTNYGKIGAIWFDGWWDHNSDSVPFDWRLSEQYALIHKLQPSCLIGNNHHVTPFLGEDFQLFERDVPGENSAGLSGQKISHLPLETCQTMNGMWGYKVVDQNYKSLKTLIQLLVKTSGKGANLLLNVGPQPDGNLPEDAVKRLKGMGEWLQKNGETIYGTQGGHIADDAWGTTTKKGNKLFVHVLNSKASLVSFNLHDKVKKVVSFLEPSTNLKYVYTKNKLSISLPEQRDTVDYIVEVVLK